MEDEVIKRIIVTPAEGALLVEQCEGLKVDAEAFIRHLGDRDTWQMIATWGEITSHIEYMQNVLQAKADTAARALWIERNGGDR